MHRRKFFLSNVVAILLCTTIAGCDNLPRFIGPQKLGAFLFEVKRDTENARFLFRFHKRVGGNFSLLVWCSSDFTKEIVLKEQILPNLEEKAVFTEKGWRKVGGAWFEDLPASTNYDDVVDKLFLRVDDDTYLVNPANPTLVSRGCRDAWRLDIASVLRDQIANGDIQAQVLRGDWWNMPPLLTGYSKVGTKQCLKVNSYYVKGQAAKYEICGVEAGDSWRVVKSFSVTARLLISKNLT